jgi:hypothetical protein
MLTKETNEQHNDFTESDSKCILDQSSVLVTATLSSLKAGISVDIAEF